MRHTGIPRNQLYPRLLITVQRVGVINLFRRRGL